MTDGDGSTANQRTILVADDDLTTRLVLTGVLRKWDHEVVVAVDNTPGSVPIETARLPRHC